MKITDLLKKQSICLDGKADSKEQVIREMVDLMAEGGNINDIDTYRETVFKREEEGTTGIGEGIAIPHGKTEAVSAPGLAAMVLPEGVDYDSLDGEPAYLIFLIAAPNTEDNVHLEVLSRLSMLLMDEDFRNKLLHAKDVDEFLAYVDAAEKRKNSRKKQKKKQKLRADASAKTVSDPRSYRMPDRYRPYLHGGGRSGKESERNGSYHQGRNKRIWWCQERTDTGRNRCL